MSKEDDEYNHHSDQFQWLFNKVLEKYKDGSFMSTNEDAYQGAAYNLRLLNQEFERKFGRNREVKDASGKDAGEWLDLSSGYPLDRYRSMVTEYAWLAFVYGRTGIPPETLRHKERGNEKLLI